MAVNFPSSDAQRQRELQSILPTLCYHPPNCSVIHHGRVTGPSQDPQVRPVRSRRRGASGRLRLCLPPLLANARSRKLLLALTASPEQGVLGSGPSFALLAANEERICFELRSSSIEWAKRTCACDKRDKREESRSSSGSSVGPGVWVLTPLMLRLELSCRMAPSYSIRAKLPRPSLHCRAWNCTALW